MNKTRKRYHVSVEFDVILDEDTPDKVRSPEEGASDYKLTNTFDAISIWMNDWGKSIVENDPILYDEDSIEYGCSIKNIDVVVNKK